MKYEYIFRQLPYAKPFLFVDELTHIDSEGAEGSYTFNPQLDFYQGHFKGHPVTPGVILTECCAQIGLVCLGIHLLGDTFSKDTSALGVAMSSSEMEFYTPVYPGDTVRVHSEKLYFRFNKLKCKVKMYAEDKLVCKGVMAGMLKFGTNGK